MGCMVDDDCMGDGKCVEIDDACITVSVSRCKYCVQAGESLLSISQVSLM